MDKWKNKQKIIAKIVCLLLSMGLWFYVTNIENPIKTYNLTRVPVEILNKDKLEETGLTLSPNQQFYVSLNVEGNAQDLFSIERNDFKVVVDLSEFTLKNGENKIAVNVKESPANVRIKNSGALTITVYTEEYITKEVPVKSKIEVLSQSSYYIATPIFNPTTVWVSGPQSLVDKVTKVIAEGEESNAIQTIVKNYILTPVDAEDNEITGVEMSQKWAEATIEINEGKTVPIKINTTGQLGDGLRIKSITSSVTEIGITGPENSLDKVTEIGTEVIDLSNITETTNIEVALGIPDNILIHNGENSIIVNIAVEKIQTKEFALDYAITGVAEGFTVVPSTAKVVIQVSAYEELLNSLTEDNFAAILDLASYTQEGTFTVTPKVSLVGVEGINIDTISDISVDIVKDTPTGGDGIEEPQE